ncbi:hypothetical protein [Paremcibacter congregatus]|uniref:hypothetical protein n=1 Tax=Paremcibacter congregatus TaxID=2043170 RepID=UPI0030EC08E3|tara:strand:+ start:1776 stop:2861 length:1086 start_codon:yes stop_codon:yes gene_type:complete
MRIEREGYVDALTPILKQFLEERFGGISLDKLQSSEERRADYVCLDGALAIEIKTLEGDSSERMKNLSLELQKQSDYPLFLGGWPLNSVIKNMSNPHLLTKKAISRIGRPVVAHIKKANKQLAAHSKNMPHPQLTKILLLINEDHEIYQPQIVAQVAKQELERKGGNGFSYSDIHAVIYITERHVTLIDDQLIFPFTVIEGPAMNAEPWKRDLVQIFRDEWGSWAGKNLLNSDHYKCEFRTIEHVPSKMKRHELWALEYRRNPYLRSFTNDQLRDKFDENIVTTMLWGLKSSPCKMSSADRARNMEIFTHLQQEISVRGLPITFFKREKERELEAAKRLRLPQLVIDWLKNINVKSDEEIR